MASSLQALLLGVAEHFRDTDRDRADVVTNLRGIDADTQKMQ